MSAHSSPQAREDYKTLLETLMPFAQQMLQKQGEFFPFGVAVDTAGEVTAHATYDGAELPDSEAVIASLIEAFRAEARAGRIRAAGICFDGRIVQDGKQTDAIIVNLEHATGSASKTYVPYKKGMSGKYQMGDMAAGQGEPKIFVAG